MVSVVDIIQRLFMVSVVGCLMVSVVAGNVFVWFPPLLFYGFRRGRKTLVYGFRRWILGGFCRHRRIQTVRMYRAIPRFLFVFRTGFRRWF